MGSIHTGIKATREGRLGRTTASAFHIDGVVPFVALPDWHALHRFVRLRYQQQSVLAIVLDVGPWNIDDAEYVFGGARPQAESGIDKSGRVTNHAGIDLSEYIWHQLHLADNVLLDWEFIE